MNAQYPRVYPDGRATFRLAAPNTAKVPLAGAITASPVDMTKGEDGIARQITETVYVTAEDGGFQVYIIPARQRTRRMRAHIRVAFYTMESRRWKRCGRDACVAKMDAEA